MTALRRGWWILVLCAFGAGFVAHRAAAANADVYESTARLVLGPAALAEPGDIVDTAGALDGGPIVTTFAEVMTGTNIAAVAAQRPALSDVEITDYVVDAAPLLTANVVELSVRGPDARQARLIAFAVSEVSIEYFLGLYPVYRVDLLDAPSLDLVAVAPDPGRDAALAAFGGAMVGLATVLAVWARKPAPEVPRVRPDGMSLRVNGEEPVGSSDRDLASIPRRDHQG